MKLEMKKFKENVFIQGRLVFSYNTHVATINGDSLIEHGKYSKTTRKHIESVARFFGLTIIDAEKNNKPEFEKLPFGVKLGAEFVKLSNNA